MSAPREQLAGIDTVVTGGTDGRGGGDGPLVILLHGFGATGDDLAGIADATALPPAVRWAFPVGPLVANAGTPGGRAWWQLNLMRMERIRESGRLDDLCTVVPDGLSGARARVMELLAAAESRFGVGPERMVLGGFSQGAMLSCDVALRLDRQLAGLVMLSGTLIAEHEWLPLLAKRRGLPVFQSHGDDDAVLPLSLAERLRDHLTGSGATVDWVGFRGGHEVPSEVVERLGRWLGGRASALGSKPPS